MPRPSTAQGKRIKTIVMGADTTLATTVVSDIVAATHQWADDVRLIGFELGIEFNVQDVHVNADGKCNGYCELSRSAVRSQPGALGRQETLAAWSAAVVVPSEIRKNKTVIFPEGYGFDFDEGDYINLLQFLEWVGAGGDIHGFAEAILYYVER
ncbi:hypothetical protein ES703_120038 [subsurface metagenome]